MCETGLPRLKKELAIFYTPNKMNPADMYTNKTATKSYVNRELWLNRPKTYRGCGTMSDQNGHFACH